MAFLRILDYDNTAARRVFMPPNEVRCTWAWYAPDAIMEQMFHNEYADFRRQTITPRVSARLYAVPWRQCDAYVCGRTTTPPVAVPFDRNQHGLGRRAVYCHCGCGQDQGFDTIDTTFAVIICGGIRRRRTHKAR